MPQYINSIKVKQGKFGLKVSGKVEDIIAELKANQNDKGYINLDFNPRKQPGKYGESHNVTVDEWKPTPNVHNANSQAEEFDDFMKQDGLPF